MADDPLIGAVLGDRYRIDELVGAGGMGKVYLGLHTMMRKRMAIKVIHPELTHVDEVVARFEREAVAAGQIEHPNAVAATDFGKTTDGALYLVMEYVEGLGLDRCLKACPRFGPARAIHVARQILRALRRAHALGIVHRDIKPENVILVERDGDPDFVKVLDFGIAKMTLPDSAPSSPLTQVGKVYGTPEYMSPEQAAGTAVDARADLYAVGVVLYEMLCGRRPFESESPVELLGMHVTAAPPWPTVVAPDGVIPPALEAIVLRLLAKVPGERHQSASEVLDALDRVDPRAGLADTEIGRRPATAGPAPWASGATAPPELGAALGMVGAATRRLLERSTRRAVQAARTSPRRAWLVAGAAAAVIGVGTLFIASAGEEPADEPARASSTQPRQAETPQLSEPVQANDATGGRAAPPEAAMQRTLGSTLADAGELVSAVAHYRAALELDPRYADDPKLRADLVRALGDRRSADAARDVLRKHVGERVFSELAEAVASKRPVLRKNARELLGRIVPAERIPGWIREVDALRSAAGCPAKREAIRRMRALGDPRVLPALRTLREDRRGCGFLGLSDCNACLRPDLAATIQALQRSSEPGDGK